MTDDKQPDILRLASAQEILAAVYNCDDDRLALRLALDAACRDRDELAAECERLRDEINARDQADDKLLRTADGVPIHGRTRLYDSHGECWMPNTVARRGAFKRNPECLFSSRAAAEAAANKIAREK